mgnify:CR=1 FL=1
MNKMKMTSHKVVASPQYLLRKKLDVLRAIQDWQEVEPDSEDERECEDRLRREVDALTLWEKKYLECETVMELDYRIRKELGKLGGVRV